MHRIKTFVGILLYAIILFGIVAVIVFGVNFFNNGQNTFYVRYGDTYIYVEEDILLDSDTASVFNCKRFISANTTYKVKIMPNTTYSNFDFIKDDNLYPFFGEKDLTAGFDLTVFSDCFVLSIPEELTMTDILSAIYSESNVVAPSISLSDYRFSMYVQSNDGTVIRINFGINGGG